MSKNNLKGYKFYKDDKMRGYGVTDFNKKVIKVNPKRAKKTKQKGELLDSMVHEMTHVKHPDMSEKNVQNKTTKTIQDMSSQEKQKIQAKFRMKKINYKLGATKRKMQMSKGDTMGPGTIINKAKQLSLKDTAIRGLI